MPPPLIPLEVIDGLAFNENSVKWVVEIVLLEESQDNPAV